ncbi:MAG: proteasome ATPase [Actinomycetaceae bacterium]|nr:proteasome ATPase [Actinomycetaceae bacterium]
MSEADRHQIRELEEKNARLVSALQRARTQLRAQADNGGEDGVPASVGIFLSAHSDGRRLAQVALGSAVRVVAVSSQVDLAALSCGQQVWVSDDHVLVQAADFPRQGEVVTVAELLGLDRVIVRGGTPGERVFTLAGPLRSGAVKVGDSLLVDSRAQVALQKVVRASVDQMLTPETPQVEFSDIGGLGAQIELVRDAIELPFTHPQLHATYGLKVPRGILLYGPPGCGKTLIAKAVANSLSRARRSQPAHFISVKGPELLNKYVGETERHIRTIFSRARKLASRDVPVVIFFDEMEALFRTRGSGISSDMETLIVPQLLAEMDGVEALDNVIIIGASNREDMIDPAVLRPGRFDLKVHIDRPDRIGAREIFAKYLTADLPLSKQLLTAHPDPQKAVSALIDEAVETLFSRSPHTAMLHARTASGQVRTLYAADLISGAMIASIVERTKQLALKSDLAGSPGIDLSHLRAAITLELDQCGRLVATTDLPQWAQVSGLRGQDLVAVEVAAGEVRCDDSEQEANSE